MNKIALLSVIASGALLFTGCATILDGKTQKINLSSTKSKTVEIDGQQFSSPGIVTLQRSGEDKIIKVKDCGDKTILLKKEVNPTFFVNILSGGVFGSTTDYSSDSMWRYDQSNINVDCN
ncbi:MAG TPA: hypothetical protein PKW30_05405 [Campylobacterales bacterium]|nr:hypothetical protein [Campylobacterales bacterium]